MQLIALSPQVIQKGFSITRPSEILLGRANMGPNHIFINHTFSGHRMAY